MENDYRQNQRKSYILMRTVYDITMALLILSIGIIMLAGDKLGNDTLKNFILDRDPMMRYLFGGLCILYGGFRLYRGIKRNYWNEKILGVYFFCVGWFGNYKCMQQQ